MIVKNITVGTILKQNDPRHGEIYVKRITLDADTNRVEIKPSQGKLIIADLDEEIATEGSIYDF